VPAAAEFNHNYLETTKTDENPRTVSWTILPPNECPTRTYCLTPTL
jgi:hypothetical protein